MRLPDPTKRPPGKGNMVRNIRLYNAGEPDDHVLDEPEVRDLINVALNRAKVPMPDKGRRKLIIKVRFREAASAPTMNFPGRGRELILRKRQDACSNENHRTE
jgi:hypothetical protein